MSLLEREGAYFYNIIYDIPPLAQTGQPEVAAEAGHVTGEDAGDPALTPGGVTGTGAQYGGETIGLGAVVAAVEGIGRTGGTMEGTGTAVEGGHRPLGDVPVAGDQDPVGEYIAGEGGGAQ